MTSLRTKGEDLAINLWDLGSGRRVKKMTGHTSSIYSLAFSAESSLLVSGGADWTVRCWDVKAPGGLPEKPRENGMVNGNGASNLTGNAKDYTNSGVETYVYSSCFCHDFTHICAIARISLLHSRQSVPPLSTSISLHETSAL